jgi:hypothetical protein
MVTLHNYLSIKKQRLAAIINVTKSRWVYLIAFFSSDGHRILLMVLWLLHTTTLQKDIPTKLLTYVETYLYFLNVFFVILHHIPFVLIFIYWRYESIVSALTDGNLQIRHCKVTLFNDHWRYYTSWRQWLFLLVFRYI